MRSAFLLCLLFGLSVTAARGSPLDLSVAASSHHHQKHGDGLNHDNDVGYLKKSDEKGGDGYEHFESFHNKDGDAYGYEKHEAFGNKKKGDEDGDEGKKGGDYKQEG